MRKISSEKTIFIFHFNRMPFIVGFVPLPFKNATDVFIVSFNFYLMIIFSAVTSIQSVLYSLTI